MHVLLGITNKNTLVTNNLKDLLILILNNYYINKGIIGDLLFEFLSMIDYQINILSDNNDFIALSYLTELFAIIVEI